MKLLVLKSSLLTSIPIIPVGTLSVSMSCTWPTWHSFIYTINNTPTRRMDFTFKHKSTILYQQLTTMQEKTKQNQTLHQT